MIILQQKCIFDLVFPDQVSHCQLGIYFVDYSYCPHFHG